MTATSHRILVRALSAGAVLLAAVACLDTSGPFAVLTASNDPDDFELVAQTFERTANTTLTYSWTHSSNVAEVRIGPADSLTSAKPLTGSGTLRIQDASGADVFNQTVTVQKTDTTIAGMPGTWKITLFFGNAKGDVLLGVKRAPRDLTAAPNTTGNNRDPDGYTATLDGTRVQSIPLDATYTFLAVGPGSHTVVLSGVAANCTVTDGTSRTLTVPASVPTTATFAINCT